MIFVSVRNVCLCSGYVLIFCCKWRKLDMSRNHTFHFLHYFFHQYNILFIFIIIFAMKKPLTDYSDKLKSVTSNSFDTVLFIDQWINNLFFKPKCEFLFSNYIFSLMNLIKLLVQWSTSHYKILYFYTFQKFMLFWIFFCCLYLFVLPTYEKVF